MRLAPTIALCALLASGCARTSRPAPAAAAAAARSDVVVFEGMCDASGAVPLADGRFVVGDDEDNILRVFDPKRGGAPLLASDLSSQLQLPERKRPPEADIEAGTALGEHALWLTSHGRRSSGKLDPSRLRVFATTLPTDGRPVERTGEVYTHLLDDLLADPRLGAYGLAQAAGVAPKEPGGLNIEGLTATADGAAVLVGFRSPVPQGRALVVPVLNPRGLVAGERARLGEPRLLDLGGLGVRSLSWWRGRYLVIGGGTAGAGVSRLFTWQGGDDTPVPVASLDLAGFNPEAFVSPEDRDALLLLSDDGTVPVDGVECKRLKDPTKKRFRGLWVRLPPAS